MKKYIFLIVVTFLLSNCQEVVEIELEDTAPRLVIDAYFEINNSTTSNENGVQLSLSVPFFDEIIPPVSDAVVYITNLNNNTILNFQESSKSGFFIPENNILFTPNFNIDYQLTVIYNNETYTATTQLIPSVPLDKLTQGDGVLFEGDETEVIVEFTDDASRNDFYIFDLSYNLFVLSEDTFYEGQTFNFSYFYNSDILNTNEVTIKIMGVDEDYFNYFNLVLSQSEQNGSPFQTPPALIKGNLVNTTNLENFAFGYFRISEADSQTLILQD